MFRITLFLGLLMAAPFLPQNQAAEDRRARVLNDRAEVQSQGKWIYNNLNEAVAEAGRTGKPILAVIRCIP
ncbi:MAG: hypothetical protein AB1813_25815 [Verrucomicrobiota bacterium]|jgi:serine protease Do